MHQRDTNIVYQEALSKNNFHIVRTDRTFRRLHKHFPPHSIIIAMKTISYEIIEQVSLELAELKEFDAQKMVHSFGELQPVLMEYLASFGTDEEVNFTEGENEVLFFIGVTLWRAMSSQGAIRSVTEEALVEIEEKVFDELELYDAESGEDFDEFIEKTYSEKYDQYPLLEYVLDSVFDALDDEELGVSEDSAGLMIGYLKTCIDVLSAHGE